MCAVFPKEWQELRDYAQQNRNVRLKDIRLSQNIVANMRFFKSGTRESAKLDDRCLITPPPNSVRLMDVETLNSNQEINSEILMFFCTKLNEQTSKLHLNPWIVPKFEEKWNAQDTQQWTAERAKWIPASINDASLVFIPCNVGGCHWILYVYVVEDNDIFMLDSLANNKRHNAKSELIQYLIKTEFALKRRPRIKPMDCTQQRDSYSCGVCCILNMRLWPNVIYPISRIPYARKALQLEVITGILFDCSHDTSSDSDL